MLPLPPFGGGGGGGGPPKPWPWLWPDLEAAVARRTASRSSLLEPVRQEVVSAPPAEEGEPPGAGGVVELKLSIFPKMDHLFFTVVSVVELGGVSLLLLGSLLDPADTAALTSCPPNVLFIVSKPVCSRPVWGGVVSVRMIMNLLPGCG